MERTLARVTGWLLRASSELGNDYFQLPVAGSEEPEYRERVYCYELYHRWRSHWGENFAYSLSGEVDKQGHPLIRVGSKPDFLVHVPGEMSNLLVMEVKPKNGTPNEMLKDLKKLTKFRRDLVDRRGRPANYYGAYFWVYGISPERWPQLRGRLLERIAGNEQRDQIDLNLISCYVHEAAGVRATPVGW
jgi:hypothetical protein